MLLVGVCITGYDQLRCRAMENRTQQFEDVICKKEEWFLSHKFIAAQKCLQQLWAYNVMCKAFMNETLVASCQN